MDTRNTDIKISMPNTPVGLSEWTNAAVNQVILESNVIHTMINNLDRNEIAVLDVKKHDSAYLSDPFLVVKVDGFALLFSHVEYCGYHNIKVDLWTFNPDQSAKESIYTMIFDCEFNQPLKLLSEDKPGFSSHSDTHTFIGLLPEELKKTAMKICDILKDTINSSECNVIEINM